MTVSVNGVPLDSELVYFASRWRRRVTYKWAESEDDDEQEVLFGRVSIWVELRPYLSDRWHMFLTRLRSIANARGTARHLEQMPGNRALLDQYKAIADVTNHRRTATAGRTSK